MGTRSDIIVQLADGSWKRVYCHWDGYLGHNGQILFDHYSTQERADELVRLGDMSSLGPRCDCPPGHTFACRAEGRTTYYGRDRGETECEGHKGLTLADVWPPSDTWTEYTYVFAPQPGGANEPQWFVGDPDLGPASLVPLKLALQDPANWAPKPDVKSPWGVIGHRDETRAEAQP